MFYKYYLCYRYSPLLAQIVITRRCNLSCRYCNEYDHSSPVVPTYRLLSTISKLKALHLNALSFTGGEPTLHHDLIEIIEFASSIIPKVSMITNGFNLTHDLIKKLNTSGLGRMQISLDGFEPNKMTQKVIKRLDPKLNLLARYATFRVHINTVLGSIPFEETLQTVKYARYLGFETTVQWLHDENGYVMNPFKIGRTEIKQLSKECRFPIYHSRKVIQVGLKKDRPWKCRAGSRYLYIDERSNAHFCSQAMNLWTKPVDNLNQEIFKQNFYTAKACAIGCTIGCVRDASKYDEFRSQHRCK